MSQRRTPEENRAAIEKAERDVAARMEEHRKNQPAPEQLVEFEKFNTWRESLKVSQFTRVTCKLDYLDCGGSCIRDEGHEGRCLCCGDSNDFGTCPA